jgi:hypothetical protein
LNPAGFEARYEQVPLTLFSIKFRRKIAPKDAWGIDAED